MRGLFLSSSIVLMLSFASSFAGAGSRVIQVEPAEVPAGFDSYKGYIYDLSENADRKDEAAIVDLLKRQFDIVDNAGFSPKVVEFFHSVPIIAGEMSCLDEGAGIACYGPMGSEKGRASRTYTTWDEKNRRWSNPNFVDLAADAGTGVIMFRPTMLKYAEDPVILHELLHAYHAKLMPQGFDNIGLKAYHADAMTKNVFTKEDYVMKNHKEFFAVTASIFLAGKESIHEPHTRARLKEKLPKYYKYLVELFGFDPEPAATPVAEAPKPDAAPAAMAPGGT